MIRKLVIGFAAAALGLAALLPAPAAAQGELPPFEAVTIIRSMGMDPLGRPVRRGSAYVLRALDAYGQEVTVTLDAREGRVLSVRPAMAAAAPYGPPPAAYPPAPYGNPPYAPPRYALPPDLDDDDEFDVEYQPIPPGAPPPVVYAPRASYSVPRPPARVPTAKVPTPKSAPVSKTASSPASKPAAVASEASSEITTASVPEAKAPAETSSSLAVPPVQTLE